MTEVIELKSRVPHIESGSRDRDNVPTTNFTAVKGTELDGFGREGERKLRLSVSYFASRKCYFVTVSAPMAREGFETVALFTELKSVPLFNVTRRSDKAHNTAANWVRRVALPETLVLMHDSASAAEAVTAGAQRIADLRDQTGDIQNAMSGVV